MPAKHDYEPAILNKFSVFPAAAPGADLGPADGANGFAVVSNSKVTLRVVIPDETQIDPDNALVPRWRPTDETDVYRPR